MFLSVDGRQKEASSGKRRPGNTVLMHIYDARPNVDGQFEEIQKATGDLGKMKNLET